MSLTVDALAVALERELGAPWVSVEDAVLAAHAVDGLRPRVVCRPADADQISAVLRLAADAGAAVTPWGGGTAIGLGNVPERVDVVLGTDRLAALIEHDAANLTATAQTGMTLSDFNARLGAGGQFLALDPPSPGAATLGGTVAANLNGPRRMSYGGARDVVIGMRMVLAGGEQIKSGGKVVKNVAGYDLCKLFTGALGTLGVITEVTVKVTPLPEAAASIVARGSGEAAMRLVDEIFASVLQPTAVTVTNAQPGSPVTWTVAAAAEGFAEAVERHLRDIETLASGAGMSVEVRRGSDHEALWARIRDFPGARSSPTAGVSPHPAAAGVPQGGKEHGASSTQALIRLGVPPASVWTALESIAALDAAWSRTDREAGGRPPGDAAHAGSVPGEMRWVAHAPSGAVFVSLPARRAADAMRHLTGVVQAHHGHIVLMAAPAELKRGFDVWGPPPQALGLMREIKRRFDPANLLNPGRYVGRL